MGEGGDSGESGAAGRHIQLGAASAGRFEDRSIRKGYEATLLLVDGNPLEDISATERISMVLFKGEHVGRSDLFKQE